MEQTRSWELKNHLQKSEICALCIIWQMVDIEGTCTCIDWLSVQHVWASLWDSWAWYLRDLDVVAC